MLQSVLISVCCFLSIGDTLQVARVSSAKDAVTSTVAPVHSITSVSISERGILTLDEAVKTFAGVSVKDYGGIGGLKTVSIRNMGAAHTAVLYDGIAISNAQNGQVDISRFNLDDVSVVRLNVGVTDEIFTSARHLTSSGVLKIETGRDVVNEGHTTLSARFTAASFNTYNPYVSIRSRFDSGHFLAVSAYGLYSQGNYPFTVENGSTVMCLRRTGSDVHSAGGEIDYHADWKAKGMFKVKGNCHFSERGLPGPVIYYTVNPSERLWDRAAMLNASYQVSVCERLKFHTDIGFTHSFNRHIDSDPAYQTPFESIYLQNEYTAAARILYEPMRFWSFSAAADFYVNTLESNIPECAFPVRFSFAGALMGQYRRENLRVVATVAGNFVSEMVRYGKAPDDRFRLSPALGINWHILNGLHLRASIKDGYRMPSFNDLYYARVGTRDLLPEKALQLNVGTSYEGRWRWGSGTVSADAYYNNVKDKIAAVPAMFIWKMRNIGKASLYGIDMSGRMLIDICKWLNINTGGTYSLQYAIDVTDPAAKNYGHQIPYVPRHCGSAYISFLTAWVNISCHLTAAGERFFGQQNLPYNRMKPYTDINLSLNRGFHIRKSCRLDVSLEGLNLSGRNHEIINSYPMSGRSYRISIKFTYS